MESFPTDAAVEVMDRLASAGETVAVAESHTGGFLASSLVSVPGASDVFREGVVAYVYGTKLGGLGVAREVLDEHGAVSGPTAEAMARGIRDTADVTWGVATTGVAGPSGGSAETPVGTTYIGLAYAGPWGSESSFARSEHHVFEGDRVTVMRAAAEQAVDVLADAVDGGSPGPPSE